MYSNANYSHVVIRHDVPASACSNDNWQMSNEIMTSSVPDPINFSHLPRRHVSNGNVSSPEQFLSLFASLEKDSQEKVIRLYSLIYQLQQAVCSVSSPDQDRLSTDETNPSLSSNTQTPSNNESTVCSLSSCSSTSTTPTNLLSNQVSSKITKPSKMKNQNSEISSKSQKSKKFHKMCSSFQYDLKFDVKTMESYQREQDLKQRQPKRKRGRPRKSFE